MKSVWDTMDQLVCILSSEWMNESCRSCNSANYIILSISFINSPNASKFNSQMILLLRRLLPFLFLSMCIAHVSTDAKTGEGGTPVHHEASYPTPLGTHSSSSTAGIIDIFSRGKQVSADCHLFCHEIASSTTSHIFSPYFANATPRTMTKPRPTSTPSTRKQNKTKTLILSIPFQ